MKRPSAMSQSIQDKSAPSELASLNQNGLRDVNRADEALDSPAIFQRQNEGKQDVEIQSNAESETELPKKR